MVKTKFFTENIGKTEKWIEQFLVQGYRLKRVDAAWGSFRFEKLPEGERGRQVKMDYRTFQKQTDFNDYVALFEDSGWKHIGGTRTSGMQYFERKDEEAEVDIFSDTISKAERYKRISYKWLGLAAAYFPLLVALYCTGIAHLPILTNWKSLYLTPGLWEETGMKFLGKFLFETPFAIMRGFSSGLLLLLVILYFFFGLKALYWYYKEKK